jgi:hypothetical protein
MRRLLDQEILTDRQVWWAVMNDGEAMGDHSDPLSDQIPESVQLIADTREQVFAALTQAGREPWLALSEHDLRTLVNQALPTVWQHLGHVALKATGAPAWWAPEHRYGLAVHGPDLHPLTLARVAPDALHWHWVTAASAADALEKLESLGVRGELNHLVDVQVVMAMIDQLKSLRTHRGAGAWTDARFTGSLDARRRALRIEERGGAQAHQEALDRRRASLGKPAPHDPHDTMTVAA